MRPENRRFLEVRLLAIAHLAGPEPVGHGDELDLGDEVGHLDQGRALALARFDALIAAGRVGDAAVQEKGEIGQEPAAVAAAGLEPGVKDPAEGALAGSESDHGGVQANGRLIIGGAAVGGDSGESLSRGRSARLRARSKADRLLRPKASATFC